VTFEDYMLRGAESRRSGQGCKQGIVLDRNATFGTAPVQVAIAPQNSSANAVACGMNLLGFCRFPWPLRRLSGRPGAYSLKSHVAHLRRRILPAYHEHSEA